MGYKIVRHEWDLTPEEQEEAGFILEVSSSFLVSAKGFLLLLLSP
jgi:hypothetical protein